MHTGFPHHRFVRPFWKRVTSPWLCPSPILGRSFTSVLNPTSSPLGISPFLSLLTSPHTLWWCRPTPHHDTNTWHRPLSCCFRASIFHPWQPILVVLKNYFLCALSSPLQRWCRWQRHQTRPTTPSLGLNTNIGWKTNSPIKARRPQNSLPGPRSCEVRQTMAPAGLVLENSSMNPRRLFSNMVLSESTLPSLHSFYGDTKEKWHMSLSNTNLCTRGALNESRQPLRGPPLCGVGALGAERSVSMTQVEGLNNNCGNRAFMESNE